MRYSATLSFLALDVGHFFSPTQLQLIVGGERGGGAGGGAGGGEAKGRPKETGRPHQLPGCDAGVLSPQRSTI